MKILPWMMKVKVCGPGFWMPTLWLPLFLLWPVLLLLAIPAFILGFAAILIFDARSIARFFRLCGGLYLALCELRGTLVDVEGSDGLVLIAVL